MVALAIALLVRNLLKYKMLIFHRFSRRNISTAETRHARSLQLLTTTESLFFDSLFLLQPVETRDLPPFLRGSK